MKKLILTLLGVALVGASVQSAKAGDREWAVAGKVLTGLAVASVISHAVEPAPVYAGSYYSYGPSYSYNYAPPPPVVYAPPPVVVYRPAPPVYYAPAPVVSFNFGYHGNYGYVYRPHYHRYCR